MIYGLCFIAWTHWCSSCPSHPNVFLLVLKHATEGGGNLTYPRVWGSSLLTSNQRHIFLMEVQHCEDTRPSPRSPLEAANHQHSTPCQHLE